MKRILSVLGLLLALGAGAITLLWDQPPSNQQVERWYIYRSDQVTGPWNCIGSSTTTSFWFSLAPCEAFFYVTASNFWGESAPSNITNTPAPTSKTTNVTIQRVP